MPRTAPAVNGTPTFKRVSIRYVDSSGSVRADSVDVAFNLADAVIEDYLLALEVVTNANIYAVEVVDVYNSDDDSGQAVNLPRASVSDNIVAQYDGLLPNTSVNTFIPAPVDSVFLAGTDTVDPTNSDMVAYLAAGLTLIGGAPRTVRGLRYTERKRRGRQVRF